MISTTDIIGIGKFNKTHGISGEISAILDIPTENILDLKALVVDEDGILVPYFVESYRNKSKTATLLTLDGITSEIEAKHLIGKTIYALKTDIKDDDLDDDDDNAYSLIGYVVQDIDNGELGSIIDIDDSTENYLFIVETAYGGQILIPIVDEFIVDIDYNTHVLLMNLPEGLLNI
ncbi:MAG: 16S rRNA processing protein RimM [Muribaculaceae bacterium]|nr:16S rRNA processing protein RimM [Muribaculaceae bacterium]